MANFVDNPASYRFNPYIPQTPVDAMVGVGIQLQSQYNAGVEKVQSLVDSVTGLPITEKHRAYLDQTIGNLKSAISKVTSSDFRDMQLVNQIGGLTTQISKDPIIQAGVQSALAIQKGYGDAEQARKEGKSSVVNEAFYANQVNQWMNDGNLKDGFSGKFRQYIDLDKKLQDVADKLKPIEGSEETPWKTDAQGNILYDSNGNPVEDMAIKKLTYKGVSQERLLNSFYNSLSEDDKQQLYMNSWYNYQGADKNTFIKDVNSKYDNLEKASNDAIDELNTSIATGKLNSVQKAAAQAKINDLKSQVAAIPSQRQNDIRNIDSTDLNQYKYKLYTDNYLLQKAANLANFSKSLEYKNNPYFEGSLAVERINMEHEKMVRDNAHWLADFSLKTKEFELKQREQLQKEGKLPVVMDEGLATDVPAPTQNLILSDIDNIKNDIKDLGAKYAPIIAAGSPNPTKVMDDLYKQYLQNPSMDLDNASREYLEKRRQAEQSMAIKSKALKGVVDQANQLYGTSENAVFAKGRPIVFNDGTQYSVREVYDFFDDIQRNFIKSGGNLGTGSGSAPILDSVNLIQKYSGKFRPLAIAYSKYHNGQPLTASEKSMLDIAFSNSKAITKEITPVYSQKAKYVSGELAKMMPEYQSKYATLTSKPDLDRVAQLLGNSSFLYNLRGALDTRKKGDFDPDKLVSWHTGKQKDAVTYTIEKRYDGSGTLNVTLGTETQKVPLTKEALQRYFPAYAPQNSLQDALDAINMSYDKSTNINKKGDPTNAYFSGFDIPGLKENATLASRLKLDIEASPVTPGAYQLRAYWNGSNGIWKDKVLNKSGYTNIDGISSLINNIGTTTVDDLEKLK